MSDCLFFQPQMLIVEGNVQHDPSTTIVQESIVCTNKLFDVKLANAECDKESLQKTNLTTSICNALKHMEGTTPDAHNLTMKSHPSFPFDDDFIKNQGVKLVRTYKVNDGSHDLFLCHETHETHDDQTTTKDECQFLRRVEDKKWISDIQIIDKSMFSFIYQLNDETNEFTVQLEKRIH